MNRALHRFLIPLSVIATVALQAPFAGAQVVGGVDFTNFNPFDFVATMNNNNVNTPDFNANNSNANNNANNNVFAPNLSNAVYQAPVIATGNHYKQTVTTTKQPVTYRYDRTVKYDHDYNIRYKDDRTVRYDYDYDYDRNYNVRHKDDYVVRYKNSSYRYTAPVTRIVYRDEPVIRYVQAPQVRYVTQRVSVMPRSGAGDNTSALTVTGTLTPISADASIWTIFGSAAGGALSTLLMI